MRCQCLLCVLPSLRTAPERVRRVRGSCFLPCHVATHLCVSVSVPVEFRASQWRGWNVQLLQSVATVLVPHLWRVLAASLRGGLCPRHFPAFTGPGSQVNALACARACRAKCVTPCQRTTPLAAQFMPQHPPAAVARCQPTLTTANLLWTTIDVRTHLALWMCLHKDCIVLPSCCQAPALMEVPAQ